jgi:hypothetical protein
LEAVLTDGRDEIASIDSSLEFQLSITNSSGSFSLTQLTLAGGNSGVKFTDTISVTGVYTITVTPNNAQIDAIYLENVAVGSSGPSVAGISIENNLQIDLYATQVFSFDFILYNVQTNSLLTYDSFTELYSPAALQLQGVAPVPYSATAQKGTFVGLSFLQPGSGTLRLVDFGVAAINIPITVWPVPTVTISSTVIVIQSFTSSDTVSVTVSGVGASPLAITLTLVPIGTTSGKMLTGTTTGVLQGGPKTFTGLKVLSSGTFLISVTGSGIVVNTTSFSVTNKITAINNFIVPLSVSSYFTFFITGVLTGDDGNAFIQSGTVSLTNGGSLIGTSSTTTNGTFNVSLYSTQPGFFNPSLLCTPGTFNQPFIIQVFQSIITLSLSPTVIQT